MDFDVFLFHMFYDYFPSSIIISHKCIAICGPAYVFQIGGCGLFFENTDMRITIYDRNQIIIHYSLLFNNLVLMVSLIKLKKKKKKWIKGKEEVISTRHNTSRKKKNDDCSLMRFVCRLPVCRHLTSSSLVFGETKSHSVCSHQMQYCTVIFGLALRSCHI